jgi:hypothetical protein
MKRSFVEEEAKYNFRILSLFSLGLHQNDACAVEKVFPIMISGTAASGTSTSATFSL